MTAVPPGHKTPSAHKPSLSRRSSISAGHGHGAGPLRDVDVTQIGVPVVTPRKERPGHKRSLTGEWLLFLPAMKTTPPVDISSLRVGPSSVMDST
jgi:starch phosphorylase